MRERDLLAQIHSTAREFTDRYLHVLVGPGDDCAVLESRDARSSLLKVDQLIEGRHFLPQTPLSLVARKALARPISDIAAMAGEPTSALVAGAFASDYPQDRASELIDALQRASEALRVPIVGGDIASTGVAGTPLVLSVTILGTTHERRGPVLRSGVRAGDFIYVTGALGGSFDAQPTATHPFPGGGHHLTFTPRVREAQWLASALDGHLRAMMDISDGLGMDAGRLARASGVRILLDARALPLRAGVRDPMRALGDGEDYELLFACPRAPVPAVIPGTDTPVTLIGVATQGEGCALVLPDGSEVDVDDVGYEHGVRDGGSGDSAGGGTIDP